MPNSLLWTGLVVMWLFVLFPMFLKRHPKIRMTTDAALSTRVLFRGGSKRRLGKREEGLHESDPDWAPEADAEHAIDDDADLDDYAAERDDDAERDDEHEHDDATIHAADRRTGRAAWMSEGTGDMDHEPTDDDLDLHAEAEDDYRDADERDARYRDDEDAEDFAPGPRARRAPGGEPMQRRYRPGRGGFDPEADAVARAARYSFRQRAVLGLLVLTVLSGAIGLTVTSTAWYAFFALGGALVVYLGYLRKQVRLEADIRRRRMARLNRSRLGVENTEDEELRLVPERLRHPGAVVLEIDDEDPEFMHLDHYQPAIRQRPTAHRIPGMRRAAGE